MEIEDEPYEAVRPRHLDEEEGSDLYTRVYFLRKHDSLSEEVRATQAEKDAEVARVRQFGIWKDQRAEACGMLQEAVSKVTSEQAKQEVLAMFHKTYPDLLLSDNPYANGGQSMSKLTAWLDKAKTDHSAAKT